MSTIQGQWHCSLAGTIRVTVGLALDWPYIRLWDIYLCRRWAPCLCCCWSRSPFALFAWMSTKCLLLRHALCGLQSIMHPWVICCFPRYIHCLLVYFTPPHCVDIRRRPHCCLLVSRFVYTLLASLSLSDHWQMWRHLQNSKYITHCRQRRTTVNTHRKCCQVSTWFFARPFVKWFALYAIGPLSVCDFGVLWPNGWTDQHATWCGGRPRPRRHCIRWDPASPIIGPCLLWPNGWMD